MCGERIMGSGATWCKRADGAVPDERAVLQRQPVTLPVLQPVTAGRLFVRG